MAFNSSKKLTTAENEERKAASAVTNYGDFAVSDATNKYKQDMNSAYSTVKNYGDFKPSNALVSKEKTKTNAENAVSNYGSFDYNLQSTFDDVMNKRLNREAFSYDVTGDALYQQYKDQYVNQGKMAMMDTMGQAAALTGGYGNSYSQMAGQQAYQGYLQQLNDKVPELYQLALDKYKMEGDELDKQYAMLADDRATEYGEWSDGYNRAVANRDYYANDYNNAYSREYGEYNDKYSRNVDAYNMASDAYNTSWDQDRTVWRDGLDRLIDQRDYAGNYATNLYGQEYGAYRDGVDDAWKQKQFDYNAERDAVDDAWKQKQFDYNAERDAVDDAWKQKQFDYNAERDAVDDRQWQDEFDEMVRTNDASIKTNAQQTAADNCYSAIESGVMPSDDMIKKAGLDKATVTSMVNQRKAAVDDTSHSSEGNNFEKYVPTGKVDEDGNVIYLRGGKEFSFAKGTNPYTGTKNKDAKNGTFSNGYQPNNVNGKKLSKTGITDVVNGVTQNVWKDTSGQKWIWDGTKNAYLKYED